LHRTVLGVPGPITSTMSEGVHALLRAGEAILVTDVAEILEAVSPMGEHLLAPRRGSSRDTDELSELERRLLDAVPVLNPAGVSRIAITAGVAVATALGLLHQLRARDLVEPVDQGWRLSERSRTSRRRP
jgi:DNA processing protein